MFVDLVGSNAGLEMFDQSRAVLDRFGQRLARTYFLTLRARIIDLDRRGDEALATIDKALAAARSGDETIVLSELLRLRGEYLLGYRTLDAEPAAEREIREAVSIAQRQNNLFFELRASHSLANLLRSRGDEPGALQLLEPVSIGSPKVLIQPI